MHQEEKKIITPVDRHLLRALLALVITGILYSLTMAVVRLRDYYGPEHFIIAFLVVLMFLLVFFGLTILDLLKKRPEHPKVS